MEVISRLREQGKDYPVLILTARADWQDKVEGLSAGMTIWLNLSTFRSYWQELKRSFAGHRGRSPVI
jgi:CheY-like chemotaxis protein